jgi:hypothetical protein
MYYYSCNRRRADELARLQRLPPFSLAMAYSIRQVNHDGIKLLVCKIQNKVDGYILKKSQWLQQLRKYILLWCTYYYE